MPAETFLLPEVLDLKAAAPLKVALLELRGGGMQIDASEVRRMGGLCLQVLLAGARAWSEDGMAYTIEPRSEAFSETLALFGAETRFGGASAIGESQ